jgi:hypothetical protein
VYVLGPEYDLNARMSELLFPLPLLVQEKLVDLVEQLAIAVRRPARAKGGAS